jgi:hypothetical protein
MAKKQKVAIDIASISNFKDGGRIISPIDILNMMRREGVLIYNSRQGVAPILFDADADIKLLDSNSKEGKEALARLAELNKG